MVFWEVSWSHVGIKIRSKIDPKQLEYLGTLPGAPKSSRKLDQTVFSNFNRILWGELPKRNMLGAPIDIFQRSQPITTTKTRVLYSGHETHGPSATPSRKSVVADIIICIYSRVSVVSLEIPGFPSSHSRFPLNRPCLKNP